MSKIRVNENIVWTHSLINGNWNGIVMLMIIWFKNIEQTTSLKDIKAIGTDRIVKRY